MMTDKECRLMKIAMDASEVSIAALQMAQANGYLKTREAKSRLLDAIVSLNFAINTSVFDEKDIAYMAAKYRKMEEMKWRENDNIPVVIDANESLYITKNNSMA